MPVAQLKSDQANQRDNWRKNGRFARLRWHRIVSVNASLTGLTTITN